MATFGKTGGPQLEIVKATGADGFDITQSVSGELLCDDIPLLTSAVVFIEQAADEELSTTTSTTLVSKFSHTTTNISVTGNYRIDWQLAVSNSTAASGVEARVKIAGTKQGGAQYTPIAANDYTTYSGFMRQNLTGNITIDFDYKAIADTGKIKFVRLYITQEV